MDGEDRRFFLPSSSSHLSEGGVLRTYMPRSIVTGIIMDANMERAIIMSSPDIVRNMTTDAATNPT